MTKTANASISNGTEGISMELSLWELKRDMATYYQNEAVKEADEAQRRRLFAEGDRLCEDKSVDGR